MDLIFNKEKETKNTVKFLEVQENESERPVVGSIYIRKDIAGDAQAVKVSIKKHDV